MVVTGRDADDLSILTGQFRDRNTIEIQAIAL
jgi:hypothetical protein